MTWISPDLGEFDRAFCYVQEGTQNAGTSWVQVKPCTHSDPDYNLEPKVFIQFSSLPSGSVITAGAGLTLVSGVLNVGGTLNRIAVGADNVDIDPAYAGQASITTLGAVTAGSWEAGVIDSSFGGTGVNNLGHTFYIEGDFRMENSLLVIGAGVTFRYIGATVVTLPAAGFLTTRDGAETFTNKRITRRVASIATSPNPAINTDILDVFFISSLSEAIASMTANLTGTPTDRQQLEIWIKQATGSLGPGYTITWGAKFVASPDLPLPTTTLPNVLMYLSFIYANEKSKWVLTQKLNNIP